MSSPKPDLRDLAVRFARKAESDEIVPWAVEFRYDDVLDERLDRASACAAVEKLRTWVDGLLAAPKS